MILVLLFLSLLLAGFAKPPVPVGGASLAVPVWKHGGVNATCPQGSALPDGCAGAPSAAIEFPTLLAGYAHRPAWNVPGVEYGVGVPTGTSQTGWTSYSNGLCTVTTGTGAVRCDGAGAVTIDSVDFTGGVGGFVYIPATSSATSLTVTKGLFHCGSSAGANQAYFILVQKDIPVTVTSNTMDGVAGTACTAGGGQSAFIAVNGNSITITYNRFDNGQQHVIEQVGGSTAAVIVKKWNSQYDMARGASHENWTQLGAIPASSSLDVEYNLGYQDVLTANVAGEGDQTYANNSGNLSAATLSHNVFIATGSGSMSNIVHCGTTSNGPVSGTNTTNYFDITGASAAYYRSGGDNCGAGNGWTNSSNIDMITGSTISP